MYTAEIVRRQQFEAMVRLSKKERELLPFYEVLAKRWGELVAAGQEAPESENGT